MQSTLFFLLFFISLTFCTNYKKRKRLIKNNILNPGNGNTQKDFSQISAQTRSTSNLQISITDLLKTQNKENFTDLLNKLLQTKNIFHYIFAYLSLFELEFNFKSISKSFYHLYTNFLQKEKILLKELHLKNKTKFMENINCTRDYFDFFEKRQWDDPSRVKHANVDYFSEDLVLFPKSIRQIICFTFQEIEYKYVLFKTGHLSILKKLNKGEYFISTSLEKDFGCFDDLIGFPPSKIPSFQENVRWIEIQGFWGNYLGYHVCLHKTNNFEQYIWNAQHFDTIFISDSFRNREPKLLLKNISGYLIHGDEFVNLWQFKKQNDGIYKTTLIQGFKTNVKEIKSYDFQHHAEDVPFIFKTD
jgi:hypothetical protein